MSKSLVAFDTDKIKQYVFATGKLKEIRGASALLDYLNLEVMEQIVEQICGSGNYRKVYANGGAGLFVVDTEKATAVITAIKKAYQDKTKTASITGVAVPLPQTYEQNTQNELTLIRYLMRATKDSNNQSVFPLTHPLLHFCDSCGIQYAEENESGEQLCASCKAKRAEDNKIKNEIALWTSGKRQPQLNRLWGRLIEDLGYQNSDHERPEDFEELGKLSSPTSYMGLIYADGDSFGKAVEEIETLDKMASFATAVNDIMYQVVQEAIQQHLQPDNKKTLPFDILLLGGDDLIMVTKAQSAIEVAQYIVARFPELTKKELGQPLSLSASVTISHINYPIGSLMEMAGSSLKFAKKQKAVRGLTEGLINFLVVDSANHLEFGEYYKAVLKQNNASSTYYQQAETIYRTQRPYTAQDLDTLLGQIRELRALNTPRTKLEQLRKAIFNTRRQAQIDAMMTVLRLRNQGQRDALLGLMGSTPTQKLHIPWIQVKPGYFSTPILDVVELFDFIQ